MKKRGDFMRRYECVYCGGKCETVGAQRLWPNRDDIKGKFIVCWNCGAHAGLDENEVPKGYPAKQHIRELRSMVLSTWFAINRTGAMTWEKSDQFHAYTREKYGWDMSEMGWMEEDELRDLLLILDRMVIPDTPEVDALFA